MSRSKTSKKLLAENDPKLYKIKYKDGLEIYGVGKDIKEAKQSVGIISKHSCYEIIPTFNCLVSHENIKFEGINNNRTIIQLGNFMCMKDDFGIKEDINDSTDKLTIFWYCTDQMTGNSIKLICT